MASEGFIHNPTNQKTRKGKNKMKVNSKNTALVVTDPQNDFLSPMANAVWTTEEAVEAIKRAD